jgi:Spy/CpxP family protein refolding chaperone
MLPALHARPGGWMGRGKAGPGGHRGPEKIMFRTMGFIAKNQEALEISDEQMERLKDVCRDTRKQLIRTGAEIKVLSLDLKDLIEADTIDTAKADSLIDQKTQLENKNQKLLIQSLAEFKSVLSPEQQAALKKRVREKMEEIRERRCDNRELDDRPMRRFHRNRFRD